MANRLRLLSRNLDEARVPRQTEFANKYLLTESGAKRLGSKSPRLPGAVLGRQMSVAPVHKSSPAWRSSQGARARRQGKRNVAIRDRAEGPATTLSAVSGLVPTGPNAIERSERRWKVAFLLARVGPDGLAKCARGL